MKRLSLEDMVQATNIQALDQALEFAVDHATEFEEVELMLVDSFNYDKDVTDDLFKYVNPLHPRDESQYDFLKRFNALKEELKEEVDHMKVLKFCLHHFDITDTATAAKKLFKISAVDKAVIDSCVKSLLKARNLIPNLPPGTVTVLNGNGNGHTNGNGNGKRKSGGQVGRPHKIKLRKAPDEILNHKDNLVQLFTPGTMTGLRGEPAALRVTDPHGHFHHWGSNHPDVEINEDKTSYGFVPRSDDAAWIGPWRGLMSSEMAKLAKQGIAYQGETLPDKRRRVVHLPDWWVQGQGGEA